jgi:hypothetical protein
VPIESAHSSILEHHQRSVLRRIEARRRIRRCRVRHDFCEFGQRDLFDLLNMAIELDSAEISPGKDPSSLTYSSNHTTCSVMIAMTRVG